MQKASNSFACVSLLQCRKTEVGSYLSSPLPIKVYKNQLVGKAAGMSLHESQSLFLEMQIVKTKEFNIFLEKILKKKIQEILFIMEKSEFV